MEILKIGQGLKAIVQDQDHSCDLNIFKGESSPESGKFPCCKSIPESVKTSRLDSGLRGRYSQTRTKPKERKFPN